MRDAAFDAVGEAGRATEVQNKQMAVMQKDGRMQTTDACKLPATAKREASREFEGPVQANEGAKEFGREQGGQCASSAIDADHITVKEGMMMRPEGQNSRPSDVASTAHAQDSQSWRRLSEPMLDDEQQVNDDAVRNGEISGSAAVNSTGMNDGAFRMFKLEDKCEAQEVEVHRLADDELHMLRQLSEKPAIAASKLADAGLIATDSGDGFEDAMVLSEAESDSSRKRKAFEDSEKLIPPGYDLDSSALQSAEVRMSSVDRAKLIELHEVTTERGRVCVVEGQGGWRSVRATHGALQGCYYFEVTVRTGGVRGNVRVGVSNKRFELEFPVGADEHSYGIRDETAQLVHCACRKDLRGQPIRDGDVIGVLLDLNHDGLEVVQGIHMSEEMRILTQFKATGRSTVREPPRDGDAAPDGDKKVQGKQGGVRKQDTEDGEQKVVVSLDFTVEENGDVERRSGTGTERSVFVSASCVSSIDPPPSSFVGQMLQRVNRDGVVKRTREQIRSSGASDQENLVRLSVRELVAVGERALAESLYWYKTKSPLDVAGTRLRMPKARINFYVNGCRVSSLCDTSGTSKNSALKVLARRDDVRGLPMSRFFATVSVFRNARAEVNFGPTFAHNLPAGASPYSTLALGCCD
mmetsp:Transcript_15552/g.41834  ORF Transcript_15552/g.41834 Transcript_15552/m.41834 type:complete len:638 (-) Transcript_15552:33-1946(-)